MRLARTHNGSLLAITDERAVNIGAALGLQDGDPLRVWLERGGTLQELLDIDQSVLAPVEVDIERLTAPIGRPPKIIGAPVNYLDHKAEMNEQKTIADYGVFLKAATSIIGPGEAVELPYTDKRTDQEGELAVIIGKRAKNVSVSDALDYVLGYSCVLDITVRSQEDRSTRKSYDTFTPLGPWIVTADEITDPENLELQCWVAGELRQKTNTSSLIYSVAQTISYASHVMTLEPGDVIATGTPAGVGPISAGDDVVVEIESIGRLEVKVTDKNAIAYHDRPQPDGLR